MKQKKGKTVCLFSAKGGVGKTITTLNLAGIIPALKKKVLIIDLDFVSGGISLALNIPSSKSIYNLYEDLNNGNYTKFQDYVTTYNELIDFIPNPKDPRQGSKIDAQYIETIIEKAAYLYDLVLIDTTHALTEANLVTLDKVDNILFLFTNDPLDLKNMKSLLTIFQSLSITNYKMLLNNSKDPFKNYFSLYDIKNILKTNIDYVLPNTFFIKNIDNYIINGNIITLDAKKNASFAKIYSIFFTIITDILDEKDEKGDL